MRMVWREVGGWSIGESGGSSLQREECGCRSNTLLLVGMDGMDGMDGVDGVEEGESGVDGVEKMMEMKSRCRHRTGR